MTKELVRMTFQLTQTMESPSYPGGYAEKTPLWFTCPFCINRHCYHPPSYLSILQGAQSGIWHCLLLQRILTTLQGRLRLESLQLAQSHHPASFQLAEWGMYLLISRFSIFSTEAKWKHYQHSNNEKTITMPKAGACWLFPSDWPCRWED